MFLTLALAIAIAATLEAQGVRGLLRAPLRKGEIRIESPKSYLMRTRTDPKSGRSVEYDPKPEIQFADEAAGKYLLRWIGYDGATKVMAYQRPDMIDVTVNASADSRPDGQYLYAYRLDNATSSVENVAGFAVQSLSLDVAPIAQDKLHIGRMSKQAPFIDGIWTRFAPLAGGPEIRPGASSTFQLTSPDPPGLVECRAHGPLGLKGVGEEPPMELENQLPGYEIWPTGHTIGPVGRLVSLSQAERAAQLLEWLPELKRAGWLKVAAADRMRASLTSGNVLAALAVIEDDFKNGNVTSEVVAIVRGLAR